MACAQSHFAHGPRPRSHATLLTSSSRPRRAAWDRLIEKKAKDQTTTFRPLRANKQTENTVQDAVKVTTIQGKSDRPVLFLEIHSTHDPSTNSSQGRNQLTTAPQQLLRQATRPCKPAFQTSFPSRILLQQQQLRLLSDEVRQAIDKAVASAPVVLFMKGTPDMPQCGFSRASIQVLGMQGVDPAKFAAFNVLEDSQLREGIKEYSDWPTIPQLYVDKEFVGGCDIVVSMHQNGELANLLTEKKVLAATEGGEAEKKE